MKHGSPNGFLTCPFFYHIIAGIQKAATLLDAVGRRARNATVSGAVEQMPSA
jgi:hypothetical protein